MQSRIDAKQVFDPVGSVPWCSRKDGARNHCPDPAAEVGLSFLLWQFGSFILSEDMLELQSTFLFFSYYFFPFSTLFTSLFFFSSNARKTKEADQWNVWSTLVVWVIILVPFQLLFLFT